MGLRTASDIAAFASDGCSGGQSKSWELLAQALPGFTSHFGDKPSWESCCVAHDKVYWRGSTVDGYTKRKLADEELRQCVAVTGIEFTPKISSQYALPEEKVRQAFSLAADLMYQAVRLGGQPCALLPWRWGYGWGNCAFASIGDIPEKVSNLKYDEHITFFNTAAWLDKDNAYWHIPIHAWIYEPQNSVVRNGAIASLLNSGCGLTVPPENEQNFRQRTDLLIADNERDKSKVIRFAGRDITLPVSVANGKTFTILKLPAKVVKAFSSQDRLEFFAVLQDNDKRQFRGQVKLVPRCGIILVGDSGEQDPEVYGDIARRYPAQIRRILTRNADNRKAEDLRFKEAFKHVARNKWQLFDHPEKISIDDLLIIK